MSVAYSNSLRVIGRLPISSLCTIAMSSASILVDGRPGRDLFSKLFAML